MQVITRVCSVCAVEKDLASEFLYAVKGSMRKRKICRVCDNLRRRNRYLANRKSEVACAMNWKRNNKEAVSVINARYYKNRKARLALLEKH